jgi:hypothetical protein
MKQVLFILLVFFSFRGFSQETYRTVTIGLEVMDNDLGQMTWYDATKKVAELGEGWRLPTKDEVENILFTNKSKIPNMKPHTYWSSSEPIGLKMWDQKYYGPINNYAWSFNGDDGVADYSHKGNFQFYVRAVRNIK